MQLTGGQYKGRVIEVPKNVRPTLSKVREAVFNILKSRYGTFSDLKFLDLFSGSALMALEALSRGFNVSLCEINPKNLKIIKRNFNLVGQNCKINAKCAISYLKKTSEKFDVIYIDPPWSDLNFKFTNEEIIEHAISALNENGIIILEYEKDKNQNSGAKEDMHKNLLVAQRIFGRCNLKFYELSSSSDDEAL